MTAFTVTQNLPYPTGTDLVQDMPIHMRRLAEATDARLSVQDAAIVESRNPPLAVVRQKLDRSYATTADPVYEYDEVVVDTFALADLAEDNRVLRLKKIGWWVIGGYVSNRGAGGSPGRQRLYLDGTGGMSYYQMSQSNHDGNTSAITLSIDTICRVSNAATARVRLLGNFSGTSIASTVLSDTTMLWAYWMREL